MGDLLACLGAEELSLLAVLFAFALSDDLSSHELSLLGHFLKIIADTVEVIGIEKETGQ